MTLNLHFFTLSQRKFTGLASGCQSLIIIYVRNLLLVWAFVPFLTSALFQIDRVSLYSSALTWTLKSQGKLRKACCSIA